MKRKQRSDKKWFKETHCQMVFRTEKELKELYEKACNDKDMTMGEDLNYHMFDVVKKYLDNKSKQFENNK